MSEEPREIERLISRYLDEESSTRERRELERRLDEDPAAAELFEDYAAIDREIGAALRAALHRPERAAPRKSFAEKYTRVAMLAAAACLAALLWFSPQRDARHADQASVAQAPAASWFAPPAFAGDAMVDRPAPYNRSVNWVGKPKTEWIVIPTERPGEYMVLEINSVMTQTRSESQDF